jgi:hypothetical protein
MRWKPSRPEPVGLQNSCHRGFLRQLLIALLTAPERSSDDSLAASFSLFSPSFFLFCPFLVGCGIQINECCIQSKMDLTVHHTLSTSEKRNECVSHLVFKAKTRCSSYVCPGSSCHTYGQNVSTEYQCLYYIVSYYKNLLQVQKGLNSGIDPILPQAVDLGFHTPRRSLHQCTPHLLSSRA